MGFVADLLMYKIKRSDQMSDLQNAQKAMSQGGMGGQVGGMSVGDAIWGGGLDMGQQQGRPSTLPGVQTSGQQARSFASSYLGMPGAFGNPPAELDTNNIPMAMTGNGVQGMAPMGYQPRGIMGQNQMAQVLLGNPTTAAMFPQMMNAYFGEQGAMQRQMQGQDWRLNNEMPFNRETQLQIQQMQGEQAASRARADWGSPKEMQTREAALRKEYAGYADPLQQSINRFNATKSMVEQRGGDFKNVTGADAIAMVKDFAKTILPNEAVMSGDEQAIAQAAQSTFGGSIDAWVNKLNGKSPISPTELANMYRVMQERTVLNQQNLASVQQRYTNLSGAYGLNASNIVGQQIYMDAAQSGTAAPGVSPITQQPVTVSDIPSPGAGQPGIPDDLQPVSTQMFGKPKPTQDRPGNRRSRRSR